MSWIKACKEYQNQRGEGAKYIVPKKGSDEYEIVKKIFDSMEKPPKKERNMKEYGKQYYKAVKENTKEEKKQKKVKIVPPKKSIRKSDRDDEGVQGIEYEETNIRKIIRDELIQQIREQGLDSLTVEVV